MTRTRTSATALQLSLSGMLLFVACVAVNIWLFRRSILLGIIGVNLAKHVVIAYLCQAIGLDRRPQPGTRVKLSPPPPPSFRVRRT